VLDPVDEVVVGHDRRDRRADKTLYLKADAGLSYGDVIDTMDRVRRAGVERLGMVTAPAPLPPPR
jgi:biopolymer transport protein TolR